MGNRTSQTDKESNKMRFDRKRNYMAKELRDGKYYKRVVPQVKPHEKDKKITTRNYEEFEE